MQQGGPDEVRLEPAAAVEVGGSEAGRSGHRRGMASSWKQSPAALKAGCRAGGSGLATA